MSNFPNPYAGNEAKSLRFEPDKEIPSLEGKIIFITGSNSGLGKQYALDLVKHSPQQIWMTARDSVKGQAAVDEVKATAPGVDVQFLQLDLASFDSVKSAVKSFTASCDRLDLLFLNGSVWGAPAATTKEGYEIHWGISHMGHALLLDLLLPTLEDTASKGFDVRVLHTSSLGHKLLKKPIPFDELKKARATEVELTALERYSQAKLAVLLYAREVAKHQPAIKNIIIEPGPANTNLCSNEYGDEQAAFVAKNIAPTVAVPIPQGAKNGLWAATSPDAKTGQYYESVGIHDIGGEYAQDEELAKRVYDWTVAELQKNS